MFVNWPTLVALRSTWPYCTAVSTGGGLIPGWLVAYCTLGSSIILFGLGP